MPRELTEHEERLVLEKLREVEQQVNTLLILLGRSQARHPRDSEHIGPPPDDAKAVSEPLTESERRFLEKHWRW